MSTNLFIYCFYLEGFKSTSQKKFNQKIYLGENVAATVVYFCYGHTSLKRERILLNIHFLPLPKLYIHIFMPVIQNKVRGNRGI